MPGVTWTTTSTLQPGDRIVDTAGRPNPAAVKANGFVGVVRYITNRAATWKTLTIPEAQALIDAGLSILLVYEVNELRHMGAAGMTPEQTGTLDGRLAAEAAAALGYPVACPIAFAIDTDVVAGVSMRNAMAYLRAAWKSCLWPGGVYGDSDIIEAMGNESACSWLANATGWRGTKSTAHVDVVQYRTDVANGWDPNTVFNPITAWGFDGMPVPDVPPTPAPIPKPAPIPEDDEMTTCHITVANGERYAEFWGVASLNADLQPHVTLIAWGGPGGDRYTTFQQDHELDPKVAHLAYSMDTFRRDLILIGDPTKIRDDKAPDGHWSADDFAFCTG